jgi:putative NADH-flavin reductase
MKLLIFGATGGTGRQLLEQALDQGHLVTAFARNTSKLNLKNDKLTLIQGDVLNYEAVEAAVKEKDVVLCALGAPASDKSMLRAEGTKHIIHAMEKAGVRRFICQASLGYGDSREILPFIMKYLIVPLFLRNAFADHELQERYIKECQLDWIIARPANLTDGPLTGKYQHGPPDSMKGSNLKISRADVSDFMLKQLTDNTYLRQTPGLSY